MILVALEYLPAIEGVDGILMDHGRQIAHGPAAQVLTPERLNAVYGMDVPAWMRSLYAQWAE